MIMSIIKSLNIHSLKNKDLGTFLRCLSSYTGNEFWPAQEEKTRKPPRRKSSKIKPQLAFNVSKTCSATLVFSHIIVSHLAQQNHLVKIDSCIRNVVALCSSFIGEIEHLVSEHRPENTPNLVFGRKDHVQHVEPRLKAFANNLQKQCLSNAILDNKANIMLSMWNHD